MGLNLGVFWQMGAYMGTDFREGGIGRGYGEIFGVGGREKKGCRSVVRGLTLHF